MIVSSSKNFIFIHIPKTGGTSIRSCLEQYSTVSVYKGLVVGSKQTNFKLVKHATGLMVRNNIPKGIWDNSFKFAFVRNPWSWLVSGYFYARDHAANRKKRMICKGSFENYLNWCLSMDKYDQMNFITDNHNNVILDYVGTTDKISKDFDTICKRLGIASSGLPRLNSTKRRNYRKFYTKETKLLVQKRFYRQIKLFKHRF